MLFHVGLPSTSYSYFYHLWRETRRRQVFIYILYICLHDFVCLLPIPDQKKHVTRNFIVGLLPLFYKLIINNYGFPHILLHVQSDSKRTIDFKIRIFLRK